MNKGYWIVRADVSDPARFSDYAAHTAEVIKIWGGEFLVRAGTGDIMEGSSRGRSTVIQFPSYAEALNCWQSEAYQKAKTYREGAAELDVVIIEGCV